MSYGLKFSICVCNWTQSRRKKMKKKILENLLKRTAIVLMAIFHYLYSICVRVFVGDRFPLTHWLIIRILNTKTELGQYDIRNEWILVLIYFLCVPGGIENKANKSIERGYENGYVVMEIFVFILLPFFSQIPGSLFATIKANEQQKSIIKFATAIHFDAINQQIDWKMEKLRWTYNRLIMTGKRMQLFSYQKLLVPASRN